MLVIFKNRIIMIEKYVIILSILVWCLGVNNFNNLMMIKRIVKFEII